MSSESDMTSVAPSAASPVAAYYVESPSCNSSQEQSHADEMEKCSSLNSRRDSRSPSQSPCSYPRHSMTSTASTVASRLSGNRLSGNRRRWNKHYCNVVPEEEGIYEEDDADDPTDLYYSRACKFVGLALALGILFGGLCLGLWAASKPYSVRVRIKSLRVQNLFVGEGSDHTGVPTRLISANCSANVVIYNPATFFGIHVGSRAANLVYSQITVARGQLKKCYLPRKSTRVMWVPLVGEEVPLYGAGTALWSGGDKRRDEIPFKLELEIHSRGYLLGKLVKTKHTMRASCLLLINPKRTKEISFGVSSCKYL